jgi:hypothetical protein
VQGLEDVEVVDGEPVAASLIPRAVTAGELLFDDGATQTFEVGGDTSYVEPDGRPTEGEWYVDEGWTLLLVLAADLSSLLRPALDRRGR